MPHARQPVGTDLDRDRLAGIGIVIAYIVAVVTTLGVMLGLLKYGGW